MREWRYAFSLTNTERGYDLYFKSGVEWIVQKEYYKKAKVGAHTIQLQLNDDTLLNATCTCGLANCKHIAAVLIALENINRPISIYHLTAQQMVDRLTPSQKDNLLLHIMEENDDFYQKVNQLFNEPNDPYLKQELEIHQNLFNYNKQGNIYELQIFIHQFLETNHLKEDVYHYFHLLSRLKTFESDALIQSMIYQILNSLVEFMKSYPDTQQDIFHFFINDSENEVYLDFLFDHFRSQSFLLYKLELINHYLNKISSYQSWGKSYFLERYLLKKLQVLFDLKRDEEMELILNENYQFSKIREFFIVEAIQNKKYDRALKIIQDSQMMDQNNRYLLIQYQNYLIEIYEKIDSKKYFEALYYQLFYLDVGAFDIYQRFKDVCPNDLWDRYFFELINTEMDDMRLMDILLEERHFKELFKVILKGNHLYYLERKKGILRKKYPEEFDEVYKILKKP